MDRLDYLGWGERTGEECLSAQLSRKLVAVWDSCEFPNDSIMDSNREQTSLVALLSNLLLYIQTFTANNDKHTSKQTSSQTGATKIPDVLLSQFGDILVEKCNNFEPGNITKLFFMEGSKKVVMEYVISVLKERMERESGEGNNSTIIIETLIEHFFSKLSNKQKQEAESELLSEGNGMFYESLFTDIFRINETIAKTRSHRKFIRKSYERFSQFFPHVTDQQVAQHDLSKFEFVELIGYTAR